MQVLNTCGEKRIDWKTVVPGSLILGLIGFGLNAYPISLTVGSHVVSFQLGLVFPMLAALAWGLPGALIAAVPGLGAQSCWLSWPDNGWANIIVAILYTGWFAAHGWFADMRRLRSKWYLNSFACEVLFRIISVVTKLTLFRAAFALNPPFWNESSQTSMPLSIAAVITVKTTFLSLVVLIAAELLFTFSSIRTLLRLPAEKGSEKRGPISAFACIIGVTFWFVDAWISFFFYNDASLPFREFLVNPPDAGDSVTRLLVLIACAVVGILNANFFSRMKQTEAVLKRSRARFKALVENTSECIWEHDCEGVFSYISSRITDLSGYSPDELVGKRMQYLMAEESIEIFKKLLHTATSAGTPFHNAVVTGLRKDGSECIFEISGTPFFNKRKEIKGFRGVCRDITEKRKLQEAEYRENRLSQMNTAVIAAMTVSNTIEECLQAAADQIQNRAKTFFVRIWTLDSVEKTLLLKASAGKYTHLDGPHSQVKVGELKIGRIASTQKEITTHDVQNDPHISNKEWAGAENLKAFAGFPLTIEEDIVGVMGMFSKQVFTERELDVFRSISKTISLGIKRKRAEEELQTFKLISDYAACGIIIASMDKKLLYVNNFFAEMHGYSPEEIVGQPITILHSPEQMPVVAASFEELINRNSMTGVEIDHLHKDGHAFTTLMAGTCIRDKNGKPRMVAATTIDITGHRIVEKKLREMRKMESITLLAGGISHDFNNMLGGIIGFGELLELKLAEDKKLKKYAETIVQTAERAANLTAKLLSFSRKGAMVSADFSIHKTIAESIAVAEKGKTKKVKPEFLFEAKHDTITGDLDQIRSALTDIILNSIDAVSEGGTIKAATNDVTVDTNNRSEYPADLNVGNYLQVTITDNGPGIPEELREKVFEPFFTTKEVGQGSGLGLSAALGVIRAHTGSIELSNIESGGLQIRILLPVATAQKNESSPSPEEQAEDDRISPKCVLLTDDEPVMRTVAGEMLESLGCDVLYAENGAEALELFQKHRHSIDLILLDMLMPVMNGQECLKEIRRQHASVPIYISSGLNETDALNSLQSADISGFIQKPYSLKKLQSIL